MQDIGALREPQHRFRHVEIPAGRSRGWPESTRPLSVEVVGAGRVLGLDEFLALTSTTSLVVVVDGALVHERYFAGAEVNHRLLGNSATKSALASLVGVAVRSRALPDLDAAVCDYVPELAGTGYQRVTLRQLATMTSGVGWLEDYHDPEGPAARMLERWHAGAGGSRELLSSIPPGDPPGTRYTYCSPDSLVLDWVRERATGQTFAEAVGDLLAVVEAEQPAIVGLDAPLEQCGVAMAAGGLALTARDWARLGMLQVDGRWDGKAVLDPEWVNASSRPERSFLHPGRLPSTLTAHAGFGYHWWPLDQEGIQVMADGMRGQFVYVDRNRRTVVVKTSAWPYEDPWWDRQCRDLCYLGLPAIADAASGAA
jgi:CubicO group peptidase (beta-lactamase class C family)